MTGNNWKAGKELKFYRKIRLSPIREFIWPKEIKFLFAWSQEITRYISYLDAPEWILIRSQPSQTSKYKDWINLELNEHTWEISGSQHCCQNGPLCTHTFSQISITLVSNSKHQHNKKGNTRANNTNYRINPERMDYLCTTSYMSWHECKNCNLTLITHLSAILLSQIFTNWQYVMHKPGVFRGRTIIQNT